MKPFTIREALSALGGTWHGTEEQLDRRVERVVTDSRGIQPGDLFVAFAGARVDGHDFMESCLAAGAACCISERAPKESEKPCIQVENSLRAIGRLAAWYRGQFDLPVIGVTGSVGKTTTKEMLAAALSAGFCVHKTEKNHNNELGVPWTLLALEERHQVSVVEMGISDFGEMRRLTHMVRPSIAVITTIGDAHLEFLGDRPGVLRAKSEIFESMGPKDLAIVNGDDPLLRALEPPMRKITYGLEPDNDFVADGIRCLEDGSTTCRVRHHGRAFSLSVGAFGLPAVYAALAACAAGWALGLADEQIAQGLRSYETVGHRARRIEAGRLTIISDCYNANPNSVAAALKSLGMLSGARVAILGDMKELGVDSEKMHREAGRQAAGVCRLVLCCGPLAREIAAGAEEAGAKALWFEDREALEQALPSLLQPGDRVLIKASRAMELEHVTQWLEEHAEEIG